MTDEADKLLEKQSKKFEREVEESKRMDEVRDITAPTKPVKLMRLHRKLARQHENRVYD